MTELEYLLFCLSEECDEIGQRASKAARFGVSEVQFDQELNNWERICSELDDLFGVLGLIEAKFGLEYVENQEAIKNKMTKLKKYMEYSKELGVLKD